MVDIRLCLILDGRLYARLECLECYSGAPRAREARAERSTMGKKIW